MRLFAYGALSVVLVLYLASIGLEERAIGVLLTLTLVGDILVSLVLSTRADYFGRRRTLLAGAALMLVAALVFASTGNFLLLLIAAAVGVISPSGKEVGPFLPIEQVAVAQLVGSGERTRWFAWLDLTGSVALAAGSLAGGALTGLLLARGHDEAPSYRATVVLYGGLGILLALLFAKLSPAVELLPGSQRASGLLRLGRSKRPILGLSTLFALDSFAGGLITQGLLAWWLHLRFGLGPGTLGAIFFFSNLLAAISALGAAAIARRIGLLNTMVFTHLPSNVMLIFIPFMPNLALVLALYFLRTSISQMDVPTRQAFVMAVVSPEERSAAAGVTGVARTAGAALAPMIAMPLLAEPGQWIPFALAGGIKIAYDITLWLAFRGTRE